VSYFQRFVSVRLLTFHIFIVSSETTWQIYNAREDNCSCPIVDLKYVLTRFITLKDRSALNSLKRENQLRIYRAYEPDLQPENQFLLEIQRWVARWEMFPSKKPEQLCETLEMTS
jgi:hypothetical protein